MKKNREMFSGLTAWLVSACFFLGCFANKQLLEKISKLGNSHILIRFIIFIRECRIHTMLPVFTDTMLCFLRFR